MKSGLFFRGVNSVGADLHLAQVPLQMQGVNTARGPSASGADLSVGADCLLWCIKRAINKAFRGLLLEGDFNGLE